MAVTEESRSALRAWGSEVTRNDLVRQQESRGLFHQNYKKLEIQQCSRDDEFSYNPSRVVIEVLFLSPSCLYRLPSLHPRTLRISSALFAE